MKKLVVVLVAVFLGTSLNAQEIAFGAKAGVNFASGVDDETDGLDGRTGIHLGGVARISISESFTVQPELLYSAQGASLDDITLKVDYLNLPIMADYTVIEGLSLQAGPQIGFNLSGKVDFPDDDGGLNPNTTTGGRQLIQQRAEEDIDDVKSLDFGFGVGAQYKLSDMGLFFQARYTLGLNDVIDDLKGKNKVFSISAGWMFN